jgi:hypothetical protein
MLKFTIYHGIWVATDKARDRYMFEGQNHIYCGLGDRRREEQKHRKNSDGNRALLKVGFQWMLFR